MSVLNVALYSALIVVMLLLFHIINSSIKKGNSGQLLKNASKVSVTSAIIGIVFIGVFILVLAAVGPIFGKKDFVLDSSNKYILYNHYGIDESGITEIDVDFDNNVATYDYDSLSVNPIIPKEYYDILRDIIERTVSNEYNQNELSHDEIQMIHKDKAHSTFYIRTNENKVYFVRDLDDIKELENITSKRDTSESEKSIRNFTFFSLLLLVIMIIRSFLLIKKHE